MDVFDIELPVQFNPITRGKFSSELLEASNGVKYVKTQFECNFTAPNQNQLRSLLFWPKVDKRGILTYKVQLYTLSSKVNKDGKTLGSRCFKEYHWLKVNPNTYSCVWQTGRKQSASLTCSPYRNMSLGDFLELIRFETAFADSLIHPAQS